jgi:hypothetical protein
MKTLALKRIRRSQQGAITVKGVVILVAVLVLVPALVVGFYEGRKAYWDYRVREMCEKDGGVAVLEGMSISKEESDHLPRVGGLLGVTTESLADPQSPVFSIINKTAIKNGEPSILRYEQAIVRRSDRSVIAQAIQYVRSGGDVPSPAFPSSYYCPASGTLHQEISRVFKIKESSK